MKTRRFIFWTIVLTYLGILISPLSLAAIRQNDYPIVLIGGCGVWDRDEVLGIKYWGNLVDIQEYLTSAGYPTVTAAPGPVSSYYDRACEVYAQLLGKKTDYGAGHAAKYGHSRWGKDYSSRGPLIPGWGSSPAKIHIIAHSMGGPTARALVHLLEAGSELERSTPQAELSDLFQGGHHWVDGVITISSPHDGTTLTSLHYPLIGQADGQWIQELIAAWISLWGGGNSFYDWKLDQWGLTRQSGESLESYNTRVKTSNIWTATNDLANHDGSPEGAAQFNAWVKSHPRIYYFSWATKATHKNLFTGRQTPNLDMNLMWVIPGFAGHMGQYLTNDPGRVPIDAGWWPNDGVVNTRSMKGPANETIITYAGEPQPGVWNYLGLMDGWDHSDIIGFTPYVVTLTEWYLDQAKLLGSLPR